MRHKILFPLLLGLSCFGTAEAQQFSTATFNIRYADGDKGTERSWEHRRDSLVRFVEAHGLSVLGMQEALHPQMEDLRRMMPAYDFAGVGRDDGKQRGEYAPVAFRRDEWKLVSSGVFWLSETPDEVGSKGWDAALPRIATWARLRHRASLRELMFVNTHFDHVGHVARVESGKLILRKVEEIAGGLPLLLTGDFNVGMDDEVYHSITHNPSFPLLDTYMEGAPHEGVHYTWHDYARIPQPQCPKIDFVFASPHVQVLSTFIPAESRAEGAFLMSDHNPVLVTVELK